jgi:hypothetical protein
MTASLATGPPSLSSLNIPDPPPLVTPCPAPEDVQHPVGRRREAHIAAQRGAEAGRRQRRPGVVRRAVAVQVVEDNNGWRRRTRAQGRRRRAAAGALWTQMRQAGGRGWACLSWRSCALGAGPRRAAWLLGEGGGQGAAAGAGARRRGPGALGRMYNIRRAARTRGVLLGARAILRLAGVHPAIDTVLLPCASHHPSDLARQIYE